MRLQHGIIRALLLERGGRRRSSRASLEQCNVQRPQIVALANNLDAAIRLNVDQLDADHGCVHDEMAAAVERDVRVRQVVGLFEVALVGHSKGKANRNGVLMHAMNAMLWLKRTSVQTPCWE